MNSNITTSAWRSISPLELWSRRHLAIMLMIREIKVRYKQSALGGAWAVVRPLMLIIVFTFLFGTIAKLPNEDIPYPVYVFAALIGWELFANIVLGCAVSISANKNVVQKIYCPRLLFPISSMMVALFDFVVASLVLAVLMVILGVMPSANIVWLPFLILCVLIAGFSVGVWLAAASVWLHDIKFMVTYLMQLLMLLTPVGYGAQNVPEKFSWVVQYNPMATLVEAFRWCIIGASTPNLTYVLYAFCVTLVMLIGGLIFFNSLERSFADVI